jgi:surfactin synthase thioesterase subunit
MHLFCLPHAGGSAHAAYHHWSGLLPAGIRVVPLEPPGRGKRIVEPPLEDMAALVAEYAREVVPIARSGAPYAVFGHSMGSAAAYELTRSLAEAGLPPPRRLFVSGRNPPHDLRKFRNLDALDDAGFLQAIRDYGGTPEEFFAIPELVELFLPMLRSDYRLVARYRVQEPIHVCASDLVFFYGDSDPNVDEIGAQDWQRYTRGRLILHRYPGGHFFLQPHAAAVCARIAETLGFADAPGAHHSGVPG